METQDKAQQYLGLQKIAVHATKEGKLYINTSDLFSMEKVKAILSRVAQSHVLDEIRKVESK